MDNRRLAQNLGSDWRVKHHAEAIWLKYVASFPSLFENIYDKIRCLRRKLGEQTGL